MFTMTVEAIKTKKNTNAFSAFSFKGTVSAYAHDAVIFCFDKNVRLNNDKDTYDRSVPLFCTYYIKQSH